MYTKLFAKILDSSIWVEPHPTRIAWITLLAAMDEDGFCQFAGIKNLAMRAVISVEEAKSAVSLLESPDPDSSDPDHEGRRIERVPGGWMVLNAKKYSELAKREHMKEQTRERVAKFRARNARVTKRNDSVTPLDVDVDVTKDVKRDSCAEPEQNSGSAPAIAGYLPLNDKTDYPITKEQIAEWSTLYPAVDVKQECRTMKGWLLASPERRKTKRGILRFINSWLAREQDKSRSNGNGKEKQPSKAEQRAVHNRAVVEDTFRALYGNSGVGDDDLRAQADAATGEECAHADMARAPVILPPEKH